MGGKGESPSSSIDSSSHPALSTTSSLSQQRRRDLSTDLRLGLSLSSSSQLDSCSNSRDQRSDWPPIKPLLRSTLAEKAANRGHSSTFFVKVYMEGIPIGRKLDLFAHDGYDDLIGTLSRMFKTTITYPDIDQIASKQESRVDLRRQGRRLDDGRRCAVGAVLDHCEEIEDHQS